MTFYKKHKILVLVIIAAIALAGIVLYYREIRPRVLGMFRSEADYQLCLDKADEKRLAAMETAKDLKEYGLIYDAHFIDVKECRAKLEEFKKG